MSEASLSSRKRKVRAWHSELLPATSTDLIYDALSRAEEVISWLRNMTMEGQIVMSAYAKEHKPSDYDAISALREVLKVMS